MKTTSMLRAAIVGLSISVLAACGGSESPSVSSDSAASSEATSQDAAPAESSEDTSEEASPSSSESAPSEASPSSESSDSGSGDAAPAGGKDGGTAKPEDIVPAYYQALAKKDATAACGTMYVAGQPMHKSSGFSACETSIKQNMASMNDALISSMKMINESEATVSGNSGYAYPKANGQTVKTARFGLEKVDGKWYINSEKITTGAGAGDAPAAPAS